MKKKIIGLSILSLVLLLGLSSTCYASNFSEIEFKNIIANCFTDFGNRENSETIINNVFANTNYIDTLLDYQDRYAYMYINKYGSPTNRIDFYFGNDATYHCYYNSSTGYYYFKGNGRYTLSLNSSTLAFNTPYDNVTTTSTKINNVQYLIYSDRVIYNSSSGGDILHYVGWFNSDYTEDIYFPDDPRLNFVPDSNTTANVENLSQTFYLISKEAVTSKLLGILYNSRLTEGIYSDFYIYNTYQNSWQYVNDLVVYNAGVGHIDEYFNTDISQGDWVSDIYIKNRLLSPNTYFRYQFIPKNADFDDYIDVWFYVYDSNTKFNNGLVSPALTFSGDYIDQYRDETNQLIDDIDDTETNDNIKDVQDTLVDDSEVDNILSDNFSGDSLLSNIGYSPIENPFTTIILNTLQNFTDALLDSGNETLSFQVYDNTITINSDDFKLPDGALKTFITLMSNAFVIYEVCKYGFTLYEWINSGRLQNLVNESNNHQYYLF